MPKIFISYRRIDSEHIVGRIYDRLVERFGRDVFKDVDSIPLGSDFRQVIIREVESCDVVIAVIGPSWLNIADENGERRLDNPDDFVRIEIETGLRRGIPVIPLLVAGARMAPASELPPALGELRYRNATEILPDPHFSQDIARVIRLLEELKPTRDTTVLSTSRTTKIDSTAPTPKATIERRFNRRFVTIVVAGASLFILLLVGLRKCGYAIIGY